MIVEECYKDYGLKKAALTAKILKKPVGLATD
jgi:hypothetical protein